MQVVEEIRSQLVALIIYPFWFEQHFPGVDVRAWSFSNRFASTPSFIILKKKRRGGPSCSLPLLRWQLAWLLGHLT
jgi:hypothetical protein